MEQADRDKILQNIEKLIQYTEYNELMQECIERKLLFDVMREQIETSTLDKKMRHKYLLKKITHRGPKAFSIFSSILMDKFPDAYDYFNHLENVYGGELSLTRNRTGNGRSQNANGNNNSNVRNNLVETRRESPPPLATNGNGTTTEPVDRAESPSTHSTANGSSITNGSSPNASNAETEDVIELKEYTQTLRSRHNYTVQKSAKFHGLDSGSKVCTYSMRSIDRGVLFLVNIVHFDQPNKLRNGADADRDNLIALFREMGFKIFYYENLKRDEFIKLVDQLVVSSHLRKTDCLIFGLLTHGEREYASFNVEFSDLQKMDVEDILSKFSNSNCDRMVGKPKIFIFPFCRGTICDPGISSRRRTESDHVSVVQSNRDQAPNMPTYSDMKICYATVPGYRSFRDPRDGSWYIQTMCDVWSQHAHDTHLDDLLKIVGNSAGNRRTEESKLQTCSNEDRGFFKTLYFNPGFYGDRN